MLRGSTSRIATFTIGDTRSGVGAFLAGVLYNSAGLTATYQADTAATATAITLVTMTAGTWVSGGFVELSAAGTYQIGLPNAALASGKQVKVILSGAANMAPVEITIDLQAVDDQDAVRMGLTALPNANANAAGGLYTLGGTGVDLAAWRGSTPSPLNSGAVQVYVVGYSGDPGGVTTLLGRVPGTVQPQTGDAYARLGAPAGASISADLQQDTSNVLAAIAAVPGLTWAYTAGARTLSSFGSLVTDVVAGVWGYAKASAAALATTTIGRWLYDTLTSVKGQTDTISTSGVYVAGTLVNGSLTIRQGDSYTPTNPIALPKPSGAVYPADLTGWACKLKANKRDTSGAAGTTALTVTLSVVNPTTTQDLAVDDLAAATTAALEPGDANAWDFEIEMTKGAEVITPWSGTMTVVPDVAGA